MKAGSKSNSNDISRLVAAGHSKTKAIKALKDAGNNYHMALRILEQQQQQQQQRQNVRPMPTAAPSPALHLADAPDTAAAATPATFRSTRLHPCIVQYKKCVFGEYCALKEYPGNTCINYFNGTCIYGDMCKRLHFIDGVDIREEWRPHLPTTTITTSALRDSGSHTYSITKSVGGGKLQLAVRLDNDGGSCDVGEEEKGMYDTADWAAAGALQGHQWGVANPSVDKPQPFLEVLKQQHQQLTDEQGALECSPFGMSEHHQQQQQLTKARRGRRVHPCIEQCGGCKFGSNCRHAERDADVCVHFLNNRCKFSAGDCHFRHESEEEYTEKLRERAAKAAAKAHCASAATPSVAVHLSCASTQPATGRQFHTDPEEMREGVDVPAVAETEDTTNAEEEDANTPACNAEEREFLQLVEMFPDADPSLVLCALRHVGGDAAAAAAALLAYDNAGDATSTTVSDGLCDSAADTAADAALAKALQEEEKEMVASEAVGQACARVAGAATASLLTLCSLFPSVEVSKVEAVLARNHGSFEEAYDTLLCANVSIERKEYGRCWSGQLTASEQLQLEKLYTLFPQICRDIVRNAFGVCERNVPLAITALNDLTGELLSLQEQQSMSKKAVRWAPHEASDAAATSLKDRRQRQRDAQPSREDGRGGSDSSTACPVQSVEALEEEYRAAAAEAREYGDWRRVRERAYAVNALRVRVLSQACAAYARGKRQLASELAREGKGLGAEYTRLNRLAMLSLEQERRKDESESTLDLHWFHVDEAIEVLCRRVELCVRRRIGILTVVLGSGRHSKKGYSSVYAAVRDAIEENSYLAAHTRLRSVKPAYIVLGVVV